MNPASRHGFFERALHRFAFATRRAQLGLADLSRWLHRRELASFEPGPPVLVSALPRSGTTMLLHLLAMCPEFASLEVRDVPFELCPLAWRAVSRWFLRRSEPQERAHGDGILVGPESPEALEEVLWTVFFPEHYGSRAIAPWPDCARPEFVEFYAQHRREVVALRRRTEPRACRYLAKNNADVARIPALFQVLPDVRIVAPFREPLQHAASLLRQHRRFTELHARDPFARRYMSATGHFEFGADLKPIDFGGWLGGRGPGAATGLAFWVEAWIATYRHLASHARDERLLLVDFERLAATRRVAPLAERLSLRDPAGLVRAAERLQPLREHDVGEGEVPERLRADAQELHAELRRRSIA